VSGDLYIYDNATLPQCEACDLLSQLDGFSGTVTFSGNKPDTCNDTCM